MEDDEEVEHVEQATAVEPGFTSLLTQYSDELWTDACMTLYGHTNANPTRSLVCKYLLRKPYGYQVLSMFWCAATLMHSGGAVLADEMGCGKSTTALGVVAIWQHQAKVRAAYDAHVKADPTCLQCLAHLPQNDGHPASKTTSAPDLECPAAKYWSLPTYVQQWETPNLPLLLITPAPNLHQWKGEVEAVSRDMRCFIDHQKSSTNYTTFWTASCLRNKIVLTTPPAVSLVGLCRSSRRFQGYLQNARFSAVFVDEAHFIRGKTTSSHKQIRQLAGHGAKVLFITGAPFPRGPESLKAFFLARDVSVASKVYRLAPTPTMSRTTRDPMTEELITCDSRWRVEDRATKKLRLAKQTEEEFETSRAAARTQRLEQSRAITLLLQRFVIMGTRADTFRDKPLIELPHRKDISIECPLPANILRQYQALQQKVFSEVCDGLSERQNIMVRQHCMLAAFHRPRIWATLPGLMQYPERKWRYQHELLHQHLLLTEPLLTPEALERVIEASPKLKTLIAYCIDNGMSCSKGARSSSKALVFCNYPAEVVIVASALRHHDIPITPITSALPTPTRTLIYTRMFPASSPVTTDEQRIDEALPRVLVGTYAMMDKGLNLTNANSCHCLSPDWLPTSQEQAVGRVDRIGQGKETVLYTYHTPGTIEDKVRLDSAERQRYVLRVLEDTQAAAPPGDDGA